MKFTDEQDLIIKESKKIKKNSIMKINAFAGTGKTTTVVEICKSMPNKKFLVLTFNKSAKLDLTKRVSSNVTPMTVHGLAYSYFRNVIKANNILLKEPNKRDVIDFFVSSGIRYEATWKDKWRDSAQILTIFNRFLNSRVAFFKDFKEGFIKKQDEYKEKALNKAKENGESLIEVYSEVSKNTIDETNIELAQRLFDGMANLTFKKWSHNFYLKLYQQELINNSITSLGFDCIIIDEAQDSNAVTVGIIFDLLKDCPKIIVGDQFQNIYGFRNTINLFKELQTRKTYTLTRNFRAKTQSLLNKANFVLGSFKTNKEFVEEIVAQGNNKIDDNFAYLTRTNAELISLLRDNINSYKDIKILRSSDELFEGFISFFAWLEKKEIKSINYKWLESFTNVKDLQKNYLDKLAFGDLEIEKYIKLNENGKWTYDELMKLKDMVDLKNNPNSNTIFTTAHSIKGMEFNRTKICSDFPNLFLVLLDSLLEDNISHFIQERNLYYVALTRSISEMQDISLATDLNAIPRKNYKKYFYEISKNYDKYFEKDNKLINILKAIAEKYNI